MTHEQESIYSVTQEQDGLSQQPKVELKNCFRFWSRGKILIKSKISGFLYHDDHDDHDDHATSILVSCFLLIFFRDLKNAIGF